MSFTDEHQLETYLRQLIRTKVTADYPNIYPLENTKAVDIVICRNGEHSAMFFLEVKFFQPAHGRLGIGTKQGSGYQPEIVQLAPDYFEAHLRWVIVDGRKSPPSFLFVPTATVRSYMAGGGIGHKFNNIQLKIFDEIRGIDENELVYQLRSWLLL